MRTRPAHPVWPGSNQDVGRNEVIVNNEDRRPEEGMQTFFCLLSRLVKTFCYSWGDLHAGNDDDFGGKTGFSEVVLERNLLVEKTKTRHAAGLIDFILTQLTNPSSC